MKSTFALAGLAPLLFSFLACGGANSEARAVESAVTTLFVATDERDWPTVQTTFADQVNLDYTSFVGGEPALLSPKQIAANWAGFLPGFDSTHHQLGNFQVRPGSDGKTRAFVYGTATHFIKDAPGGEVWTVVGTYDFTLSKAGDAYKIESMKFNFKYQDGNGTLPKLAGERMAAR